MYCTQQGTKPYLQPYLHLYNIPLVITTIALVHSMQYLSVRWTFKLDLPQDTNQSHFGFHQSKPQSNTVTWSPPKRHIRHGMMISFVLSLKPVVIIIVHLHFGLCLYNVQDKIIITKQNHYAHYTLSISMRWATPSKYLSQQILFVLISVQFR